MIADNQVRDIALDEALMQVFVNVGEEGWPKDPMEFLYSRMHGYNMDSPDEMVPWEPFETEDANMLLELVDGFQDAFERAINTALMIERG